MMGRGRPRARRELLVAKNGEDVGRLRRITNGELTFEYTQAWVERESAVPLSLSMPLSTGTYRGDVVWNYFDNLLPDSAELRERMQRALGADSTRPFDLLSRAGADCVGALQLVDPATNPAELVERTRQIESTPLSDGEIADLLRNTRTRPLGMTPDRDDFRISVAGAQEKTGLLRYEGRWYRPSGATPTTHILKLPIGPVGARIDLSNSVENEWLCMRIASGFGLEVASCDLRDFEDVRVLVVERFDRRWSKDRSWIIRLPQEDTCQALGVSPAKKYESDGGPGIVAILKLLLQSQDSPGDRATFFRAVVVFWLLAAIDGHAKNFSLSLRPANGCRLTPLYDVMSAWPTVASGGMAEQELTMAMAAVGKNRHYGWSMVQPRHWTSTAAKARYSTREAEEIVRDCAARAPRVVAEASASLPADFPARVADPILARVASAARRLG